MTSVLVFNGAIERATIVAICDRARMLLERADAGPLICDVGGTTHPDAVVIETLARLQLTARRLGSRIELRHACGELQVLLILAGLHHVIPLAVGSGIEPFGQPEQREQVRGVEEEADAGDPVT